MLLGGVSRIKTGSLDVNAKVAEGKYPFFTCAQKPERIDTFSFDCECVLVAGNGDLNVKYYSGKFDAYQRTYVVEVIKNDLLDTRFLFHFLNKYVDKLRSQSIGGVIKYIKMANLTDIELPDYSLSKQRDIVKILDTADVLCEKRKEQLALLDDYLKSVFLEMFGDPVKNTRGYPVGKIRETVVEVKYGTSKKANQTKGQYPILRMNNITYSGEWNFTDLKYIDLDEGEVSKYAVKKGDLLFNRTNSKELVGKTAVFNSDELMVYAGYLIRCRFNKNIVNPIYVSYFLNSDYGKSKLSHMCKNIVGMANINAQELQDIELLLPPVDLQDKFATIVDQIKGTKQKMRASLDEMDNHFNALIQRYFG
jgi:type I restriction enzyme S subunit